MTETQHTADAPEEKPGDDEAERDEGEGAADEAAAAPREGDTDGLLPAGNRLRAARGSLAIAAGVILTFVIMALRSQLRFGVPLGALGVLVATFGVLDLAGSFDDDVEHVAGRATIRALAAPLALFTGGLGALWGFVCLAVDGRLAVLHAPVLTAAVLIPASFLAAVVGAYRAGELLAVWDTRPDGTPRPLLQRHGFWLVVATTLLYLPILGSHSLSDPWETHYGEVSREILARNDWVSLWWGQDGWFWSKPILDFWIQALAMATFGVRYQPDQMLSAVREGRVPWPEWAVRLPVFLLTLLAVYLLYKAVAQVFGRRAGLLGGLVLITMPQWFLVTHQTMTDMPFVAAMSAAMALLLLGMSSDPEEEIRTHEVDFGGDLKLRFSGYHLVIGAVVACALPQILYLFSRNLSIDGAGLQVHLDAFSSGSPGNCGLPGNEVCHAGAPVLRGLHPALQALIWTQALALIVYMNWGERRRQRLFFLAAWLFASIATMGKGPAGIVLPAAAVIGYLLVSGRWRDLLRLEIATGSLIFFAVALPWFVAMYARHGQPFTDRLLFHDMFKRAFTHVHDTNEGDDVSFRFYVWQLGYATFPWTGLVPAGLVWWMRRRDDEGPRGDASVFLAMWFLFAFALFSLMLTKFHHYILPAIPPVAMLVGVLLDAMLKRSGEPSTPEGDDDAEATTMRDRFERVQLGAAALAGAPLVFLVGRDLAANFDGLPNQIRLLHLFTYNYRRAWPPSLDFTRALWAFTIAASALMLLLVFARIRRHAALGLVGLGVLFAAWGLDVYFMKTSPHWGQRETTIAYYAAAREAPGPLVAYQMNWKGENFYTGNHVPAFVSSGKKFQDYIADERKKGVKTFYFVTEHTRMGTLQNEIGATRAFDKLTPPELNNKFGIVRAVFE